MKMTSPIKIEQLNKKSLPVEEEILKELERRVYAEIAQLEVQKKRQFKRRFWIGSAAAVVTMLIVTGLFMKLHRVKTIQAPLYSYQDQNYTAEDYLQELSEDEIVDLYMNETTPSQVTAEPEKTYIEEEMIEDLEYELDY